MYTYLHLSFLPFPTIDISFEAESTRGEAVVHIEEQDIRKAPAKGDETSISEKGKGCNVKGTVFTGKVGR